MDLTLQTTRNESIPNPLQMDQSSCPSLLVSWKWIFSRFLKQMKAFRKVGVPGAYFTINSLHP